MALGSGHWSFERVGEGFVRYELNVAMTFRYNPLYCMSEARLISARELSRNRHEQKCGRFYSLIPPNS